MSVFQKYLSKFSILISIFCILLLLLLESNIGFKYILYLSNYCFLDLNIDGISGNWRDFKIKSVYVDQPDFIMKASNVHIQTDMNSLCHISTIFKYIKIKDLIVLFKKDKFFPSNSSMSIHFLKKNSVIRNPFYVKKIYVDKILLHSNQGEMRFLNVLSGVNAENHSITLFPTKIKKISVFFFHKNMQKKFKHKSLLKKKYVFYKRNIYLLLNSILKQHSSFFPIDINVMFVKCQELIFFNYKNVRFSSITFTAKIKKNVLNIKKIKLSCPFFKIESHGCLTIEKNLSISYFLKNTVFISGLKRKKMYVCFTGNIYDRLVFQIKCKNLFNFRIHGAFLLNSLNYPFFITARSHHVHFSENTDVLLNFYHVHAILKGDINNYFIFFKNIIHIKNIPSILMRVKAKGNFQHIFLKEINFIPIKNKKLNDIHVTQFKKNIDDHVYFDQYMLNIFGKIKILNNLYHGNRNIFVPKIYLHGNIMDKKMLLLGSLNFRNLHCINVPKMNLFFGKNHLSLHGSVNHQLHINTFIHANHLEYFFPDLKGMITAVSNIDGVRLHPIVKGNIIGRNLSWQKIYLKHVNIRTNIRLIHGSSGYFILNAKNIFFSKFFIRSICFRSVWTKYKKQFSFFINSHVFRVKLNINSTFNVKSKNWHSIAKKLNIYTFLGKWHLKNFIFFNSHYINKNIIYTSNIFLNKISLFSDYIYQKKMYLFNFFKRSSISFSGQFSVDTQLKWTFGNGVSNGNIFLTGDNIKLKKRSNKIYLQKKIDCLKIAINFQNSKIHTNWWIKNLQNMSKKSYFFGYLDIIDIYKKKKINGRIFFTDYSASYLNFFNTKFKHISGIFNSNINITGSLYEPQILADIHFKNIFFTNHDLLKYVALCFHSFLKNIEIFKINAKIFLKNGHIVLTLKSGLNKNQNLEWNIVFNSNKSIIEIVPRIKLHFFSRLILHYFLGKYSLLGYIDFHFFHLDIDEKNFVI
ncbi:MAG: hypothetical protein ICW73_02550 [Buchnera aphidicola (Pentalonia nigronervosa)]|jgi:translocation and assembly module TamB|uniref:Translocation/assembly module TamB n=1 Tax=Buchnera aphidicola (Pentalonia nigronervosa) TaxID=1309793 RepID=A0A7H1AZC5_9GAMM|nr:MAG: hypothetical protein ICW73_02550 [Buchnera aphidicola (Pentalonia nigronervosa)]